MLQKKAFFFILAIVVAALYGCSSQNQTKPQQASKKTPSYEIVQVKNLKVNNIQGLGYPGNDNALYVAEDKGLKMFNGSNWFETTANLHNYNGFQAVETGFLASGQPQKGSGLKNPLGVVKSIDKGKTLSHIAFYGQNNFPFISSNFPGNVIYVLNEQQGKDLNYGVNYSEDGGKTWENSSLKDFKSDSMGMIAVHPQNGNMIAMATRGGVFYSENNGNTMKVVAGPFMVTAVSFLGNTILYSSVVENYNIQLKTVNPKTGQETSIPIPFLDQENPITYIAVNEKNQNQIAFSTYKNDLYETKNGGKSWNILLKNGKTEQD